MALVRSRTLLVLVAAAAALLPAALAAASGTFHPQLNVSRPAGPQSAASGTHPQFTANGTLPRTNGSALAPRRSDNHTLAGGNSSHAHTNPTAAARLGGVLSFLRANARGLLSQDHKPAAGANQMGGLAHAGPQQQRNLTRPAGNRSVLRTTACAAPAFTLSGDRCGEWLREGCQSG
jgi:hypothetical protein